MPTRQGPGNRASPGRDRELRAARLMACHGRRPEDTNQGTPVTADRPRQPGTRKRKGRQAGPAAPDPGATPRAGHERRLLGGGPGAMLLEGLMEKVPGEPDQGERKPSKRK